MPDHDGNRTSNVSQLSYEVKSFRVVSLRSRRFGGGGEDSEREKFGTGEAKNGRSLK